MGKIVYYMSMSVDGFVTAGGITADEPLGAGGGLLHEWTADPRGGALLKRATEGTGAVIVGRRTYDASVRWWGADGPTGTMRLPVFVLTHRAAPAPPAGGVYTFVTDGVDSLVRQAKATAGEKDVSMSGVDVPGQLLRAGHVDEMWLSVVPVLFGDGTRLYEHAGGEHVHLDLIEAVTTAGATHLRYRVRPDNRMEDAR